MKIFGVLLIIFGGLLLVYGPEDRRIQIDPYANTMRLIGIILIAIGIIMLKF